MSALPLSSLSEGDSGIIAERDALKARCAVLAGVNGQKEKPAAECGLFALTRLRLFFLPDSLLREKQPNVTEPCVLPLSA